MSVNTTCATRACIESDPAAAGELLAQVDAGDAVRDGDAVEGGTVGDRRRQPAARSRLSGPPSSAFMAAVAGAAEAGTTLMGDAEGLAAKEVERDGHPAPPGLVSTEGEADGVAVTVTVAVGVGPAEPPPPQAARPDQGEGEERRRGWPWQR